MFVIVKEYTANIGVSAIKKKTLALRVIILLATSDQSIPESDSRLNFPACLVHIFRFI